MAAILNIFYAGGLVKFLLSYSDWINCGASFVGQYKTRSGPQEKERDCCCFFRVNLKLTFVSCVDTVFHD